MYSTRGHSGTIRFNCILPQKLQPVFTLTPVTPSSKGCFSNRISHRDIRGLPLGNLTGLSTLSNSRFHYRSFLSLFSFLFSRKKYRNRRKLFSKGNKKTRRHLDIFLASGWPLVGCENRSTQERYSTVHVHSSRKVLEPDTKCKAFLVYSAHVSIFIIHHLAGS